MVEGQTTYTMLGPDPNYVYTDTKMNSAGLGVGLCFAHKCLCFGSDTKGIPGLMVSSLQIQWGVWV